MRQPERADIPAGEKSPDDIAARDRQIEMRRVRFVVMNRDARRTRTAQMIARQRLQRIHRRLVIGAFDAYRDTLARLKQARRRDDRNFQLVNFLRLQLLSGLMSLNRLPRLTVLAQPALRGAQPAARQFMFLPVPVDQQERREQ
jgi:hypothetical protein